MLLWLWYRLAATGAIGPLALGLSYAAGAAQKKKKKKKKNFFFNLKKLYLIFKKSSIDWEKIFAKDISDKSLISNTYKEFI